MDCAYFTESLLEVEDNPVEDMRQEVAKDGMSCVVMPSDLLRPTVSSRRCACRCCDPHSSGAPPSLHPAAGETLCPACVDNQQKLWCAQAVPPCGSFQIHVETALLVRSPASDEKVANRNVRAFGKETLTCTRTPREFGRRP